MFNRDRRVWAPDGSDVGANVAPAPAAASPAAATPAAPVSFAETLPEGIRNEAAFRDIKDLEGLAKSYLGATRMIGGRPQDLVKIPGPDDADGWTQVYDRLGRPKTPGDYKLPEVKLPEGAAVDETLKTGFLAKAHEAGLTERQASALYAWYNETAGAGMQAQQAASLASQQAAIDGLKQEWGAAFDQKLHFAKAAIQHYGGEELVAQLNTIRTADGTPLGDSPVLAKLFANLGANLAEDGVVGKSGGGGGFTEVLSPAEARQEIAALQTDKAFLNAYTKRNAPGHAEAVAKMQRLYQFAAGTAAG